MFGERLFAVYCLLPTKQADIELIFGSLFE